MDSRSLSSRPSTPGERRSLAAGLCLTALLGAACRDSDASAASGVERSAPTTGQGAARRAAALPQPAPDTASGTASATTSGAAQVGSPTAAQVARPSDPLYRAVASAIENGDAAAARREWLRLSPGLHATLLNARLYALEGDNVAAVREVEAARAAHPDQGVVFATAAEIHAAGGRLRSAEDEIRDGLLVAGETPELVRARGVLALSREGGALKGLAHLLEARRRAPDLEFTTHVLAEAYRLLGAAALSERKPKEAAGFARAALELQPTDPDTLQMLGDALAAQGDFDGALELYERLLACGAEVRAACALMTARGATAALLESRREKAVERYLRARELGLSEAELGFGANVLAEEAGKAVDAGLEAYERGEFALALSSFTDALRFQPSSLEAANHLAVAQFKLGDFEGAAARWRALLERAEREGLALPEPAHLNLARALYQLGRRDEVRALLEDWLARHSGSEHAPATREMLARLEAR